MVLADQDEFKFLKQRQIIDEVNKGFKIIEADSYRSSEDAQNFVIQEADERSQSQSDKVMTEIKFKRFNNSINSSNYRIASHSPSRIGNQPLLVSTTPQICSQN